MTEFGFDIIKVSIFLFYIFSFIISYKKIKNNNVDFYMKGFYWYPFIGALIATFYIASIFFKSRTNMIFFNRVNLISLLFHFYFLGIFVLKVSFFTESSRATNRIIFLPFVLLIAFVIKDFYNNTSSLSFCFGSFALILFSLIFYYRIFQQDPSIILLKEASFWIVTGIFIGMALSFPLIIFWDYLDINLKRPTKRIMQAFGNIPYIIMHIFFIKAYLCSTQMHKKLSYLSFVALCLFLF
jgi:hypothetical protein